MTFLLVSIIIFFVIVLLVQLSNYFFTLPSKRALENQPLVSILIPARNEQDNIEQCVMSLANQTYQNVEIIVCNDHSTDQTGDILASLQTKVKNLKVIQGVDLPEGWLGKPFACHQLSKVASGDYLLFVDADTTHKPNMLETAIKKMVSKKAKFMSAFLFQKMNTFGEKLIVSFAFFSIFSLFPMKLTNAIHASFAGAANGQFIMFEKAAYLSIGGHQSVKNAIAEDIMLAKTVQKYKQNTVFLNATSVSQCRMYHSFGEAFKGFSKNYFSISNYKIVPTMFLWFWMLFVFCFPLFALPFLSLAQMPLALGALASSFVIWLFATLTLKLPKQTLLYYPFIIVMSAVIALNSVYIHLFKKVTWKGRKIAPPKIGWF